MDVKWDSCHAGKCRDTYGPSAAKDSLREAAECDNAALATARER